MGKTKYSYLTGNDELVQRTLKQTFLFDRK
jgi:hypothetical protein